MSIQPIYFAEAQNSTNAQNDTHQIYIPTTISKEAQEELRKIPSNPFDLSPGPDDLIGWKKLYQEMESMDFFCSQSIKDLYQPNITETKLGGVKVLDIKPKNWHDNGKVLVYTHGGAYTLLSANSSLSSSILAADATSLRVISIDYTVAPFSKWNQTTDQVISVIQALKDHQGYSLDDIAIYGDSAGGGLAAGSVLKMRDGGMGMPAAVVLWSPWTDVTQNGDTYFTLKDADPLLRNHQQFMKNSADAYANPIDQENPYVSPVYGNFSKGFPPTLIQGGTKEMFVSDFVRLYQGLDQADVPVKLDIYEGMPHVFQYILIKTPESTISLSKMNDFLRAYLDY
ncbi:MAG TPA: alpha/beta hydrolase [Nitrososphaeraceae archaeon]|nr:alpha/beta hydrolase [Nitrososphaeraceae archaeon]